jgi:Mg2+/Co2+ transporter CorB
LRSVVNEAGSLIPTEHKSMLLGLLDLEEASIEDIMIPTADILGIDLNKSWHEIIFQLKTAQHTRLPLYRNTIEDLVGVVHVRSVLALALEDKLDLETLIALADEPYFVPEGTSLSQQLVHFQKEKKRNGFVVNEYGDLQGLATMEDILEEVVGQFTTDMSDICKDIFHQADGSVIVDASITLRHLKRMLAWDFPALGPRTLSGLIIEYLGFIPPSDCCLTIDNVHIEILKVYDNTIKTVRMFLKK